MNKTAIDYRSLAISERIELVQDIWDSIAAEAPAATGRSRISPCLVSYNMAHNRRAPAMSTTAVVRARIDERTKEEATTVLASMGLTVSDAFRLLLIRVAREKALPFEPLVPNETTIAAMREARRAKLETVTLDDLRSAIRAHH